MGIGLRLRQLLRAPGSQEVSALRQQAFRERLSPGASDTNEYVQPVPTMPYLYYQTYWSGNRLPGTAQFGPPPHEAWSRYRAMPQVAPLQDYGGFGRVLGTVDTARLIARWADLWRSLSTD